MAAGLRKIAASLHPLYSTYMNMLHRCHNPSSLSYPNYGARGIKVCSQWRADFWCFVSDVGEKPSPQYSLDRINNDGNYEPGNVRWADAQLQYLNSRPRRRAKGVKRALPPATTSVLSPAQESVLHAVASEGCHQGAAKKLGISIRTIKAHMADVFIRTGCKNQLQLGIWYASQFKGASSLIGCLPTVLKIRSQNSLRDKAAGNESELCK